MKLAVWTIGHFSGGNGLKTVVPEEKLEPAKAAFKGYVDEIGADIFGICEHSYMFCNSDTLYKRFIQAITDFFHSDSVAIQLKIQQLTVALNANRQR